MKPLVGLAYALMCTIWGTTWLAIKVALTGFPPIAGAGLRFVIAGAIFAAAARVWRDPAGVPPPRRLIVELAICMCGLNYALTYYAEERLASGLVAVLFGTMTFFIFGLAARRLRETVRPRVVAGALVAFVGVATIAFTFEGADALAIGATLLAAFLSADANVALKQHAAADPFRTLPPAMLLAGTAMLLAGALLEPVDPRAAFAPAPLLATLRQLPASVVGFSALLIPAIALAAGVLAGGETLGPREIAGAALVVAGMAIALLPQRGRVVPAS